VIKENNNSGSKCRRIKRIDQRHWKPIKKNLNGQRDRETKTMKVLSLVLWFGFLDTCAYNDKP
jgi:hypothetical protein